MTKRLVSMVVAFAFSGCASFPGQGHRANGMSKSALIGVWRLVEYIDPTPRDTLNVNPQHPAPRVGPTGIGMLFFTAKHYAHLSISTTEPRSALPEANPTAAQLLATWGPFGAQAGTYEIQGQGIVFRPTVAKNPHAMAPQRIIRGPFRVVGDTLWLQWDRSSTLTNRYLRIE